MAAVALLIVLHIEDVVAKHFRRQIVHILDLVMLVQPFREIAPHLYVMPQRAIIPHPFRPFTCDHHIDPVIEREVGI